MSPLSAWSLFLEGSALLLLLLLLLRATRWHHAGQIAALLALTAAAINGSFLCALLYDAPLLYRGTTVPVGMPTALCFLPVGAGHLTPAMPTAPLLRAWNGDFKTSHTLARFPAGDVIAHSPGRLARRRTADGGGNESGRVALVDALLACVLIAAIAARTARRTGDLAESGLGRP